MAKVLKKVSNPKLPHNVKVFQDHLALGLECFELDWFDFSPMTCTNKQFGDGLAFSQYCNRFRKLHANKNYSLIVSNHGIHMPNQKFMPFTNEQPPTKMALLVLSAMVMQQPLNYTCLNCD